MKIRDKLNTQLKKIKALPEKTKRIIFWSIVIIVVLGLLFFCINSLIKMVKNFSLEEAVKDLNIQEMSSKAGQATEIENEMRKKFEQFDQLKK